MLDTFPHALTRRVATALGLVCGVVGMVIGGVLGVLYVREQMYAYTLPMMRAASAEELQYGAWPELASATFFEQVHETFIKDQASFVEANLTTMTIAVYKEGELVLTVPIKSKGREGSWWETPVGIYRAQGKEETHFSSFGHVYMPWSIPFQGNFFIHGWPYYPDGTPVAEGYSGGCMRLENEYAQQVYDLVEVGMPIVVFEEGSDTSFRYELEAPQVGAASYLVADLENNFVLLAGGTSVPYTTPTLTNLMTALVATEYQNIERPIPITDDVVRRTETARFVSGATYSLYDLLFPLLLENARDAQVALASYFGRSRFAQLMQAKTQALGMNATTFDGCSGTESCEADTTAEDTFLFLKHLHANRAFLLALSGGHTDYRTYGTPAFVDLTPMHPLLHDAGFVGGASSQHAEQFAQTSGTSSAAALMLAFASTTPPVTHRGEDLLSVFNLSFGGAERPVAFIVFDSSDPAQDTRAMRVFVERMYQ